MRLPKFFTCLIWIFVLTNSLFCTVYKCHSSDYDSGDLIKLIYSYIVDLEKNDVDTNDLVIKLDQILVIQTEISYYESIENFEKLLIRNQELDQATMELYKYTLSYYDRELVIHEAYKRDLIIRAIIINIILITSIIVLIKYIDKIIYNVIKNYGVKINN